MTMNQRNTAKQQLLAALMARDGQSVADPCVEAERRLKAANPDHRITFSRLRVSAVIIHAPSGETFDVEFRSPLSMVDVLVHHLSGAE